MAAPMVSLWHAECHAVYGYVMRSMLRLQHHTGYTRRVYEEDMSDILTLYNGEMKHHKYPLPPKYPIGCRLCLNMRSMRHTVRHRKCNNHMCLCSWLRRTHVHIVGSGSGLMATVQARLCSVASQMRPTGHVQVSDSACSRAAFSRAACTWMGQVPNRGGTGMGYM